jgi:6-phosphogluconate dehydrogenase
MQIGVIGLGRMGGNIARRLIRNGHEVVVYDRDSKAVASLGGDGATGTADLAKLVQQLRPPRAVWVMLPAGKITEDTIVALAKLLQAGDIVLDGGNTFWKDDIRRAKLLEERNIHHLDVGTSGGTWGLERGYCMMIGGSREVAIALTRFSGRWRRGSEICHGPPAVTAAIRAPNMATFMPGRTAPVTSSRWSTTASNTA